MNTEEEIFKEVPNYPGLFVSNLGSIKTRDVTNISFKLSFIPTSGINVNIFNNGKSIKIILLKILVAQLFLPARDHNTQLSAICFLDGNFRNTRASNLGYKPRSIGSSEVSAKQMTDLTHRPRTKSEMDAFSPSSSFVPIARQINQFLTKLNAELKSQGLVASINISNVSEG